MPADGVGSSGYLVTHGEHRVMLDAGPGTALELSRHLTSGRLTAVFISHHHSDHILDLLAVGKTVLADRLRRDPASGELTLDEAVPRVRLFLPAGSLPVMRRLAALFPVTTHPLLDEAFELGFDVHEYESGERVDLDGLRLRFELLRHAAPDCGIRIEADDASLVYTGDTGLTDALPRLAAGAGTLLSESTLRETDTSAHGHLCSRDAGRIAREADVGELVLTHFTSTAPDDLDWHLRSASAEFAGPVSIARPGTPITVAPTRKVNA